MGLISNGNTVFDNGAMASGFGGSMVFISSQTASASASISFTSGIDSTYKEYVFYFVNIHPATDAVAFQFNMSTDAGSNYNVTKTSTFFQSFHNENDVSTQLAYNGARDLAQSTSYQSLTSIIGNDSDQSASGTLQIFNPSSTTFVKHFVSNMNDYFTNIGEGGTPEYTANLFSAGYGNTTSAVNAIDFKMSSGNIDDGTILMFGIK